MKTLGYIVNDWQLSGVWTGTTGAAYTVGVSYQGGATGNGNQNITGSPNYGGRVNIVGRYRVRLQQRSVPPVQFGGVRGSGRGQRRPGVWRRLRARLLPAARSTSRSCATSASADTRNLQFRLDMFNAPNQAMITNRNATMQLTSPTDGTQVNLPFDANGNLIATRSQPKNAGFGVATAYQAPRTLQAQLRFSF